MKRIRTKRARTVIVDLSRGSIRLAEAESAGEAVRFHGVTSIDRPADLEDDLLDAYVTRRIKEEVRRRGWVGMPAACLLSGNATSTQSFLFPAMPDAELRMAIELKLSETLHFGIEDASFDFRRTREFTRDGNKQVLTLVAAARHGAVRRALTVLRQAGLRPVAIGAAAESLANLAYHAHICRENEATIHVDIGATSTILNLLEGPMLRFSREVDTAGDDFTRALMRPIITQEGAVQLTLEQANELRAAAGYPSDQDQTDLPHGVRSTDILPLLEPVAQRLTVEIQRSIEYLRNLLDRPGIDRVLLSGPGSEMRGLDAVLQENLGVPVTQSDPVARAMSHWRLAICDGDRSSPAGYSSMLGFSLGNQEPINLLPRDAKIENLAQHESRVRRRVAPFAVAGAAVLAMAGVPIHQIYTQADDLTRSVSEELDRSLARATSVAARRLEASETAARVAMMRGPVPDWQGVLRELAALLPEGGHVTSFTMTAETEALTVRLSVLLPRESAAVGSVSASTELAVALGTSPFFTNVHVLEASSGGQGGDGRFEATLDLVAARTRPWEDEQ